MPFAFNLDLYATKAYILLRLEIQEAMMLAFDDSTKDLNERSSERMNFRTKPRIKQIIQRAAALSGVDDERSLQVRARNYRRA
jgi:hypothetical protein